MIIYFINRFIFSYRQISSFDIFRVFEFFWNSYQRSCKDPSFAFKAVWFDDIEQSWRLFLITRKKTASLKELLFYLAIGNSYRFIIISSCLRLSRIFWNIQFPAHWEESLTSKQVSFWISPGRKTNTVFVIFCWIKDGLNVRNNSCERS